jgi:hypothetical protein
LAPCFGRGLPLRGQYGGYVVPGAPIRVAVRDHVADRVDVIAEACAVRLRDVCGEAPHTEHLAGRACAGNGRASWRAALGRV